MPTLQQRMATTAYQRVTPLASLDERERKKYGTMAHKLPILIYTSGLAQALAFVEARQVPQQLELLNHLAETVALPGITTRQELTRRSREAELPEYMLLTRRCLQALLWYKRFAESILNVKARDEAPEAEPGEGGEP